jgi:hypothetical protein
MNKLSKAAEQKAMLALESAIQFANDGMTPSAAIVKAAQAAKLEAPMVQRLVEAFNVSKTLHHFKKSAGSERASTFPIASSESIMAELFPPDPTTPRKEAAAAVHPAHGDFEAFLLAKEASERVVLPPMVERPPEAYDRDPAYFAKKAIDERGKLVALHAQAKEAAQTLYWKMLDAVDKAAAYYKQLDPVEPFDLVEKRAYATYGPRAKTLMDLVVENGGLADRRIHIKRAAAEDLGTQQMTFDPEVEPYNHVADAMLFSREVARISKEAAAIANTIDEHAVSNAHLLPERDVLASIDRQLQKQAARVPSFKGWPNPAKAKARYKRLKKENPDWRHDQLVDAASELSVEDKPAGIDPELVKASKKEMPSFLKQDRPKKVKEIYRALKRDHPKMPAALKARIAAKQGKKGKQRVGPPYKAPLSA